VYLYQPGDQGLQTDDGCHGAPLPGRRPPGHVAGPRPPSDLLQEPDRHCMAYYISLE